MSDEINPLEGESEDEFEARLKDLEKRADALHNKLPKSPNFDTEVEGRLKNIEDRAATAKATRESVLKEEERKKRQDAESAKGLGVGMSVAYTFLGVTLLGTLIGFLIDKATGGKLWTGLLTLIGACIGIGMMIVTLNRTSK